MHTALFLERGRAEVRSVRAPRREAGWATIAVTLSGICNTDLELQRGYYGFRGVPGHEFTGRVEAAPPGAEAWLGRRVVGEINITCRGLGRQRGAWCDPCKHGRANHCRVRRVLGIVRQPGAHAERVTLPLVNLHAISDGVSDAAAVFVEPLAAACRVLEQLRIDPATWRGQRVLVLGDGKLGLLLAQALKTARPGELLLLGRHAAKLRLARDWDISTRLARPDGTRLPQARWDVVVEATGTATGLRQAIGLVRAGGTVVMKSTVHDAVGFDIAPVIVNEINLLGSRCGPFARALRMLERGEVEVESLIDTEYPLARAPQALARAARRGTLKVLLRP